MDHQRGRSPSTGHQHDISRSRSPSQNAAFNNHANALGLDPSLSDPQATLDPSYLATYHHQQQQQQQQQQQPSSSPQDAYLRAQSSQHPNFADASLFAPSDPFQQQDLDSIDPSALGAGPLHSNQDFDLLDSTLANNQSSSNSMAALHHYSPEPPHMLHSNRGSTHASPNMQQEPFNQQYHVRNQSLDPASAAYPPRLNGDYSGMQFSDPRRSPSDQYSDVSSSAHPSPYLGSDNNLDYVNSHSPLMNGQDPSVFHSFNLEQFSLNDHPSHISPGHSPHISPRLSPQPQPQLPQFAADDGFPGMTAMNGRFPGDYGLDYPREQPVDAFPMMHQPMESPNFPTGQMSPPEINIEAAPPESHFNMHDHRLEHSDNALSPPARTRSRARAVSDVTPNSSRSASPSARPRSPSLGLHPSGALSTARSASPAAGVQKSRDRRNSTPEQRNWALQLVERGVTLTPSSSTEGTPAQESEAPTSSTGTEANRRAQKHPATFQCYLCPKRFTRAYNLRSHLRTHTDERPFVCNVCGKAFARQHDRKRHEGLHSGEKKFVCKGILQSAVHSNAQNGENQAQTWGCGRRFARADALGRHFRSEAGRTCIKPLLDEEARERRAAMMEQHNQDMMNNPNMQMGLDYPQSDMSMDSATFGMALPAALLQQYPALAEIPLNARPGPSQNGDYGGDHSGRSSFDASSGGEVDFGYDEDGADGYASGPGAMGGQAVHTSYMDGNGWASDYEGR